MHASANCNGKFDTVIAAREYNNNNTIINYSLLDSPAAD